MVRLPVYRCGQNKGGKCHDPGFEEQVVQTFVLIAARRNLYGYRLSHAHAFGGLQFPSLIRAPNTHEHITCTELALLANGGAPEVHACAHILQRHDVYHGRHPA
jgi:hypothetical protein